MKGGHRKTSFKCVKCGTIWEASPYSLIAGHGCPLCAHTGTSFSEQFITNELKYALGEENVITRSKKLIGKELDIYIPGKRIAIEYNGWFWHKNKIASDIKKAELCVQSNCRLISIYDACPETYLPLNNDYITFEKDLALEPGYTTLKTLVELLLDEYLHCLMVAAAFSAKRPFANASTTARCRKLHSLPNSNCSRYTNCFYSSIISSFSSSRFLFLDFCESKNFPSDSNTPVGSLSSL